MVTGWFGFGWFWRNWMIYVDTLLVCSCCCSWCSCCCSWCSWCPGDFIPITSYCAIYSIWWCLAWSTTPVCVCDVVFMPLCHCGWCWRKDLDPLLWSWLGLDPPCQDLFIPIKCHWHLVLDKLVLFVASHAGFMLINNWRRLSEDFWKT
jgi:hypothetical protein